MPNSSTSASRASDMGQDKVRYLLFVCGRWRWRPTRRMRAHGFKLVTFGKELTAADKARAIALGAPRNARSRYGFENVHAGFYGSGCTSSNFVPALQRAAMLVGRLIYTWDANIA